MYSLPHMKTMVGTGTATTAMILRAISDDKSMTLFRIVAASQEGIDSDSLQKQTKFTRKQYYSRMSKMTKRGLVKRKKSKYFLTTFGKVVNKAQAIVENGLDNAWKLKAMDSLITSKELPMEEQQKILDSLLDENLKKVLRG